MLEWYRKSELSSDRAGLLASQDPKASLRVFLKLAGGGSMKDMDLDAFMVQAREYEEEGGPIDAIYKILNTLGMTHPFHTLRAAELQRWADTGTYEKILQGEYTLRGAEEKERSFASDFGEAARHYAHEAKETVSTVTDAAKRAAAAFTEALKTKDKE